MIDVAPHRNSPKINVYWMLDLAAAQVCVIRTKFITTNPLAVAKVETMFFFEREHEARGFLGGSDLAAIHLHDDQTYPSPFISPAGMLRF